MHANNKNFKLHTCILVSLRDGFPSLTLSIVYCDLMEVRNLHCNHFYDTDDQTNILWESRKTSSHALRDIDDPTKLIWDTTCVTQELVGYNFIVYTQKRSIQQNSLV